LPIDRLVIATNDNDILARTIATGEYRMGGVVATTSPSMDIQISSNFERLLFEASGRDSAEVSRYMAGLKQSGGFAIEAGTLERIRGEFDAGRSGGAETAATIAATLKASGYLLDPHTATGVHVASRTNTDSPMIVLSTAHPAKFPDAVAAASGVTPALPDWLSDLMGRREKFTVLPSRLEMVEDYLSRHARAARQGV
ncbi:MAG: threonine synthase, partial [Rhizobiaceae bacterium]|nr:threonine synthase [Rhizobiaceae bacterium]